MTKKVTTVVFTCKLMLTKKLKKSCIFWDTFLRKFVTEKFQKLTNLVTL